MRGVSVAVRRARGFALAAVSALLTGVAAGPARGGEPFEDEPIRYHQVEATDPIARLQGRLDRGEVDLEFDRDGPGYLASVLRHLAVPAESQALVFSKTSFQHARIGPRTPRAVYFGDDVYVGYVRGGDLLELSAADPELGATFYVLEQREADRPRFARQGDTCLQCHASTRTLGAPGHLVRSVYPDGRGLPIFGAGSFSTDHTSPIAQRWGGWYVTGTHGSMRHMGNVVAAGRDDATLDVDAGANRVDLSGLVDTGPYLTPHSDIVALMVLEHQAMMHNLITHLNHQTRMALHSDRAINRALGRPDDHTSETTGRRIAGAAEKVVRGLLFVDEARLEAPVAGTSGFAEAFAARGRRDAKGRSLRDFDLQTRLFRHPCSYLIESEAFEALPGPARDRVLARLGEILSGADDGPDFAHLSTGDRRAIAEILRASRPDLPEGWGLEPAGAGPGAGSE